jgi:hypothetical protein
LLSQKKQMNKQTWQITDSEEDEEGDQEEGGPLRIG